MLAFSACQVQEPHTHNQETHTHNIAEIPKIAPTCTEDGKTEGSKCIDCNEIIVAQETVKAFGHSWGNGLVSTSATCVKEGIKTFNCKNCDETRTESIPITEHVFDNGVITKPATCIDTGVKTFTCKGCSKTETEALEITDHAWDNGVITKQASCQTTGTKTTTCRTCSKKITDTIPKTSHEWDNGTITKKATCTSTGTLTIKCKTCSTTSTNTIPKTAHNWNNGTVTTQATCTANGVKTFTCTVCKGTKTETVYSNGHKYNSNNVCTVCGKINLKLTDAEKNNATKIKYISQRQIWYDTEGFFRFNFSFLDADEKEIAVPAIVEIRIVNDKGVTVYSATRTVKTSDFSTWGYNNGAVKKYQASIKIDCSDIKQGLIESGKIYYKIYVPDYADFDEYDLTINKGLPLKPSKVNLPKLPATISDYLYNDQIDSTVKITNITYEIKDYDLYIYFSGEKTYEREGLLYSQSTKVGWKLYDSENYVVASGTFYSPAVAVGEKFRNEEDTAYNCIKPGETYTFKILNLS